MSSVLYSVCAAIYAVRIVKPFGQTICCHVILWVCRLTLVYFHDILIGGPPVLEENLSTKKMCPEE